MKKIIALVLTIAMLATMAFGLIAHAEDKMNYSLDSITGGNAKGIQIEPGTEVFVLGWVVQTNGFSKLQYSIDDGTPVDGQGEYRARDDVHNAFPGYDLSLNPKPGFGLDSAPMKLPGMENLAAGTYTLKLIGVTADGSSTYEVLSIPVTVGTPEEVVTEKFDVEINTDQFPAITTFAGEGCKIAADAGTAGKEAIYLSHAADPKTDEARHADYATVKLNAAASGDTVVRLTLLCPDHINGAYGYILRYRVNNGEWKDADLSEVNDHFDFDYDIDVSFNEGENTIDFAQGQKNDAGWRIDIMRIAYNQPAASAHEPVTRDFDSALDKQYFDQVLVNGTEVANGNDALIELKKNPIDGSDGSINTISTYGWYASIQDGITLDQFGYMIDDNEPVFSADFTTATGQDVLDLGGTRYLVNIDVTGLNDGQEHVLTTVCRLSNGDIVKFNRPNREAVLRYVAPGAAETQPVTTEPETQVPTEPETNTQTGDFTVAMFAVIAVLAMGAAVVFAKKRAF